MTLAVKEKSKLVEILKIVLDKSGKKYVASTIDYLRNDVVKLTENQLEAKIKHLNHMEQIVIKTFIQKGKAELQAKCGRRQSMRYNGGFIMQYLLLKLKSSTTYTHLRKNNFLSLPRSLTIRQRLCSSNCKLCSNDLSLENIMKAMSVYYSLHQSERAELKRASRELEL
ncbi:hypothetical protein OUZ56_017208 [Daphnia magna]|uniref:Uncharacterized protein n=1 Tax=Daphnia magna TaxID=35525 RepID=A0ABR0ASL2_9CRUS|nr:hypothetical protein OUZ56_017208 [Daphnia magna]